MQCKCKYNVNIVSGVSVRPVCLYNGVSMSSVMLLQMYVSVISVSSVSVCLVHIIAQHPKAMMRLR